MNMPKLLDSVKLIPKTRHGKNRVRQHGDIAEVIQIRGQSFCTMTESGDWRWIDCPDDRDFMWEVRK